jgi:hypothetical protein
MSVRGCLSGKEECTKLDCEFAIDVHRQRPSPKYLRLFGIFDEGNKATLEGACRSLAAQLSLFRQEPIAQFAHCQPWHLASRNWSLTRFAGTFKCAILDLDKHPPKVRRGLAIISAQHLAELTPGMPASSDQRTTASPNVNSFSADRFVRMLAKEIRPDHWRARAAAVLRGSDGGLN